MSYVCLDVGGTAIKYALISEDEKILDHGEVATTKENKEQFIKLLATVIKPYLMKEKILGIGISFPGHIISEVGVALQAGAIDVMSHENIVDLLRVELQTPDLPIGVENDAKCAALAESQSGNAKDCQDFCLITIGTGIGGAIVRDGQVIHGKNYRAGELGMMLVDYSKHHFTNLHRLASTSGLIERYKNLKKIPYEQQIHGSIIFEDHSEEVEKLLKDWANYVAITIFNTVCQNDPEKVLIGGGISQNPRLLPLVQEALQQNHEWEVFKVPIEICYYHNLAGIMGAYYLVKER
ncbi:ROK family protein [Streptococcus sp. S784/96/1]|uniref:ROK family protein n=1 Tax=Streptococcus sp. S784/96/1 TaxID=2653499 RepID=UPI00138A4362|nr:ROK family protein [Streptococcus sp. S784/96/1]